MDGAGWFNVFWRACLEVVATSLGRKGPQTLCTGTGARPRESRPEFRTGPSVVQRSPLPLPLDLPFYTHPHLLRPALLPVSCQSGPLNRTPRAAGTRLANTFATEAHQGLLEPRSKNLEGCTVINAMHGGGCESIHRCLTGKRADNFKTGAALHPILEFSCLPVSLASGPRSLAVFFGSLGCQPDGESNCQRPGPPSWQSRTSVFCFIVPVKCRLSRCGSVGFNCRGRCEGGSPSDEV